MVIKCRFCDKIFQVEREGTFLCPFCGGSHELDNELFSDKVPIQGELFDFRDEKSKIPWEIAQNGVYFRSFVETLKLILFKPSEFYTLITTNKIKRALIYGVTILTVVSIISSLFYGFWLNSLISVIEHFFKFQLDLYNPDRLEIINIFLSPLSSLFVILFNSTMYHLLLSIFKRGISFNSTIKVISYASSASILSLIPLVGGIASVIYSLYLSITGLSIVHGVSKRRVSVAVLMPLILLILFLFFMVSAFLLKLIKGF